MEKIKNQLQISVSNSGFTDEGDGVISFPGGLTITDDSVMRSGTRYDIQTLDISQYQGQLTADHHDSLGTLIGKVIGTVKQGNRVAIQGIKYAVNANPYARLAYDLLVGGFSDSFSIETTGSYPDRQDPVYRDHELVGLSQVVVPNNYNAKINQFNEIVHNSLERSQQNGLDITGVEEQIFSSVELKSSEPIEEKAVETEEVNVTEVVETPAVEVEETETVETEVVETPAEEVEEVETTEAEEESEAEEEVETPVEDETETVAQPEVEESTEEIQETEEVEEESEDEEVESNTNKEKEEILEMTAEQIAEIVKASLAEALKPVTEELASTKELAQNAFDAQAQEPEFTQPEVVENSLDSLSEEELFGKQLNAAVSAFRLNSVEGRKTLDEINARNLNALKEAKIVNRALTLEDLGNFIIGPELYNQVATARTEYTAILDATQWKETNSIEFGWLTRTSDIDMQNVAIGALGDVPSPDTTNNRLKPVSTPGYGAHNDKLEEMAAVTPISINTIKFAAADILADVAEGYRNDYDRKRAQLVIARLQQAVNATGNVQTFDISDGLLGWAQVTAKISDATTVGTLVFNNKTLAALKGQAIASQNAAVLTEIASGSILGTPFVVVPNDLLPTINTTETKSFTVSGTPVTINTAVFYGDLRTFTGRTSGGLKYDIASEASYEISGVTYSAYQRNEIVLRGSFFRGGVVKDVTVIAGIPAIAVS